MKAKALDRKGWGGGRKWLERGRNQATLLCCGFGLISELRETLEGLQEDFCLESVICKSFSSCLEFPVCIRTRLLRLNVSPQAMKERGCILGQGSLWDP
jgi:hypothetical protein